MQGSDASPVPGKKPKGLVRAGGTPTLYDSKLGNQLPLCLLATLARHQTQAQETGASQQHRHRLRNGVDNAVVDQKVSLGSQTTIVGQAAPAEATHISNKKAGYVHVGPESRSGGVFAKLPDARLAKIQADRVIAVRTTVAADGFEKRKRARTRSEERRVGKEC